MKIGIDLGGMYEEPREYLRRAVRVERAGFDSLWFGDHIQPWFHGGGRAPFTWSWIPLALQRTDSIPVGVMVTPPLYRYHPLVIANAAATIERLFPGRFLMGVGTGEPMNEHPFIPGSKWPSWDERGERMREAIRIMRRYWSEKEHFGWEGEHFAFDPVYPYLRPREEIPVYFASAGPKSARLAAELGDHLITIASVPEVEDRVMDTYREHGGEGDIVVQTVGGYGQRDKIARRLQRWFGATLRPEGFELRDPRKLESVGREVPLEEIKRSFLVASAPRDVTAWARTQGRRGADHVVITDVSHDPKPFFEAASREIIPEVNDM